MLEEWQPGAEATGRVSRLTLFVAFVRATRRQEAANEYQRAEARPGKSGTTPELSVKLAAPPR